MGDFFRGSMKFKNLDKVIFSVGAERDSDMDKLLSSLTHDEQARLHELFRAVLLIYLDVLVFDRTERN